MLDDVGAGIFFVNLTVAIVVTFLFILDGFLFYIKDKKAKWIFVSIMLNAIFYIYFSEHNSELISLFNFFVWPFLNLILITKLFVKNVALYREDKKKYRIKHKRGKIGKLVIKTAASLLVFILVFFIWSFFRIWSEFLHY